MSLKLKVSHLPIRFLMDIFNTITRNKIIITGILLYSTISLAIIFYNHHYYDDEIYNLDLLQFSLTKIFSQVQSEDVHPTLSYIINKIIYELFVSYKAILIFSIIFNVAALVYFYRFAESTLNDKYSKLLLFMFVFINGGLLLWTNSVRWYAYWTPLFIILYTYLLKQQKLTSKNIVVIGILLSVMTYINYLSFLLFITICIYIICSHYLNLTPSRLSTRIKNISLLSLVYICLCLYQIYIFINLPNKALQTPDFISSLLNAVYGIVNGGSVFLASPVFLFTTCATLIIIVLGLKAALVDNKAVSQVFKKSMVLFAVLFVLMIITGVAGKYRNNIALSIPFYFIVTYFFMKIKNKKIKLTYLFSILTLSTVTVFNLVTHQNTAKNSYNMPVYELSTFLNKPHNKLIVTHSPAIYFNLVNKKYKVLSLYPWPPDKSKIVIEKNTYVYLIKTYQGSLNNKHHAKILKLYKKIINCMHTVYKKDIGKDKYYKIKNKLAGNKPKIEHVQMHITYGKMKNKCILFN